MNKEATKVKNMIFIYASLSPSNACRVITIRYYLGHASTHLGIHSSADSIIGPHNSLGGKPSY